MLGISGATTLGDLDKAERREFTLSGSNAVTFDAVTHEVAVGDRELAIIITGVVGEFDFNSVKNTVR